MSDHKELEECLEQCLEKNKEIINELIRLRSEMTVYRESCNQYKAIGTTASTLGTGVILGSVIAAPFTLGISMIGAGVGAAASAAGTITNAVTEVVENYRAREIIKTIHQLLDTKKGLNEWFENLVKGFMEKQEKLLREEDILPVQKTGVIRAGKAICQTVVKLARKASLGLSVISSAVDIAFLVRDWNSNHPTVEVIDKVVLQLANESQMFTEIQAEIERCKITEKFRHEKEPEKFKIGTEKEGSTFKGEEKNEKCYCRPIQLKVFYLNARDVNPDNSLIDFPSKLQEIRKQIQTVQPNIVVIVESWINHEYDKHDVQSLLGLSGYKIYRRNREMDNFTKAYTEEENLNQIPKPKRGGGIMIAYRRSFQYPRINFKRDENEDYGDSVVTFNLNRQYNCNRCNINSRDFAINFTAAYHRAEKSDGEGDHDFEVLDSYVDSRIHHIANVGYPDGLSGLDGYCIVGDFNRDFFGGDDISDYVQDPSQCISLSLDTESLDLNGTVRTGKTIDHVFAYPTGLITDLRKTELISDHSALIFTINLGQDYPDGETCEKCK